MASMADCPILPMPKAAPITAMAAAMAAIPGTYDTASRMVDNNMVIKFKLLMDYVYLFVFRFVLCHADEQR